MTYTIYQTKPSGRFETVEADLTEAQAKEKATFYAQAMSGITVQFFNEAEGEYGYLNQDGKHDSVAQTWKH